MMIEPQLLLPEQTPERHSVRRICGERRLVAAMLADAVRCYLFRCAESSRRTRVEEIRNEAGAWIFDDDRSWCFSFGNVCDLLGIDADGLRRGLRAQAATRHVRRGRRGRRSTAGLALRAAGAPPGGGA